jgi:CelD/BcsL family acetyltransferase involved in cellulose biosynthesis
LTDEVIPAGGLRPLTTVTIETVTSLEGVLALKPCYEKLQQKIDNPLPFALHEWHVTWCRHFLNANPRIQDEPLFYVLRDPAGACVAIVPFVVSRRRIGPIKVVSVNVIGSDPAITEIRAPMVAPGYERVAAHAVQQHLTKAVNWDWIHWTGISAPFAEALAVNGRMQWQPPQEDFVLDLAPSWEEFRGRLKRNIRESLRHCYNSLKRDNHVFEFCVVKDAPQMRGALDRFFELHAMRADLKTAAVHPNRFSNQASRDFLYDICERLCAQDAVRIFQLKVGSEVVAARVGFIASDGLYLYYSGYDPAWWRYSVMTTTVAEAIKYAIGLGLKTVNLSPNREVSKTRWGPRQVDYIAAYELGPRLRSRLARQAYIRALGSEGLPSWFLQHLIPARRNWQ